MLIRPLPHDPEVLKGVRLAHAIAEVAGDFEGLLVDLDSARIVARLPSYGAQEIEGAGLAEPVVQASIQLQRLLVAGDSQAVAGHLLQEAQLVEGAGLPGPVPGLACGSQGGLEQSGGLIPVPPGEQEAADHGRDGNGMPGTSAGRGVAGRRGPHRVLPALIRPGFLDGELRRRVGLEPLVRDGLAAADGPPVGTVVQTAQGALDGVEAFLSVARHRSFRRAASQLGVTPSAISQAIRTLETRIGAALFIAPKTASVHVSNILAKLGAASRTEAAAIAHDAGLTATTVPPGG